ncbi:hypothetical protein STEG23_015811, partial [Scotinomys teguina]
MKNRINGHNEPKTLSCDILDSEGKGEILEIQNWLLGCRSASPHIAAIAPDE